MTVNLYFIACSSEDGENLDLLVQAATPIDAIELWRDSCGFEDNDITCWDGPYVKAVTAPSVDEDARVFEIHPNPGIPGVLPWVHNTVQKHEAGQLNLVGYIAYAP